MLVTFKHALAMASKLQRSMCTVVDMYKQYAMGTL